MDTSAIATCKQIPITTPCGFDQTPDEVIVTGIFKFLHPREIIECQCVCKRFHLLINQNYSEHKTKILRIHQQIFSFLKNPSIPSKEKIELQKRKASLYVHLGWFNQALAICRTPFPSGETTFQQEIEREIERDIGKSLAKNTPFPNCLKVIASFKHFSSATQALQEIVPLILQNPLQVEEAKHHLPADLQSIFYASIACKLSSMHQESSQFWSLALQQALNSETRKTEVFEYLIKQCLHSLDLQKGLGYLTRFNEGITVEDLIVQLLSSFCLSGPFELPPLSSGAKDAFLSKMCFIYCLQGGDLKYQEIIATISDPKKLAKALCSLLFRLLKNKRFTEFCEMMEKIPSRFRLETFKEISFKLIAQINDLKDGFLFLSQVPCDLDTKKDLINSFFLALIEADQVNEAFELFRGITQEEKIFLTNPFNYFRERLFQENTPQNNFEQIKNIPEEEKNAICLSWVPFLEKEEDFSLLEKHFSNNQFKYVAIKTFYKERFSETSFYSLLDGIQKKDLLFNLAGSVAISSSLSRIAREAEALVILNEVKTKIDQMPATQAREIRRKEEYFSFLFMGSLETGFDQLAFQCMENISDKDLQSATWSTFTRYFHKNIDFFFLEHTFFERKKELQRHKRKEASTPFETD